MIILTISKVFTHVNPKISPWKFLLGGNRIPTWAPKVELAGRL